MAALLGANSGVVLRACGHQYTGQQYPYTCKLWRHQWQHSLQFCPPQTLVPARLPTCPFLPLSPYRRSRGQDRSATSPATGPSSPQSRAAARPRLSVPTNTARGRGDEP